MTDVQRPGDLQRWLRPTRFIDCDSAEVRAHAARAVEGAAGGIDKAIRLYYAVRDPVRYNPYAVSLDPKAYRASAVLAAGEGFCVQKAILLAALARAEGVPSRLGFADVRNHLNTEKLQASMGTDVFAFHGYVELFLEGRWVKATPAFNRSLCERFGTEPLEFDGRQDSIFQPLDKAGNRYMEYLRFRGEFDDFPFETMLDGFREHYPHFFEGAVPMPEGDFENER